MRNQIEAILKKYTTTVNSFIDKDGYNNWNKVVDELTDLCSTRRIGKPTKHPTQEKILALMKEQDINELTLRGIGIAIGIDHPQKIDHHLKALVKWGFVNIVSGKYQLNTEYDVSKTN